jgi:shikimate dehydrogenase
VKLALLGDPVAHSRSPAIFAAAFAAIGLDGHYEARRVDDAGVRSSFEEVRQGELDGLNITMPHKALGFSLCDRVDDDANRAGSVNTVVRQDAELVGYSTDISAVRECWRSLPVENPVLILGAGGAAAAAAVAVETEPTGSVYIASRTFGRGAALANRLQLELGEVHWGVPVVMASVINCTPLGMQGEELPESVLELASGLLDMAYGPTPTPAVVKCRAMNIPVVDGHELLVTQAAHGFRLWTGMDPPLKAMRQAVENP